MPDSFSTLLLGRIKQWAVGLISTLPPGFTYHNLEHTQDVVQAATQMGQFYALNTTDLETLLLAAWAHDTGYSTPNTQTHETESQKKAQEILQKNRLPTPRIAQVNALIAATKMPQKPTTLSEMILCDADLSYLGTEKFFQKSNQLREEWRRENKRTYTEAEWLRKNITFLENHTYFTEFARRKLSKRKQQNLQTLREKQANS